MRVPKWARALLLGCLLLQLLAGGRVAAQQETAELTVFYSALCGSCQQFDARILPPLQAAYGARLQVRMVDIGTAEGLRELEQAEAAAGSFHNPLPVLLLEGELLANEDLSALEEALRTRLLALLGEPTGEGALPTATAEPAPAPTSGASPSGANGDAPPIHVAYVIKPYCDVCDRAGIMLEVVGAEYPQMVVHSFDQVADAELIEAMGVHLGLPADRRLVAPSVYVGSDALVYDEVTGDALRALLDRYVETGAPPFWEELDTASGAQSILGRFRSMGLATVVAAGLLDGVNPCAFATILFFVSYLAISRRDRKEMLLVGLAFTLGVFLTYLLVGLGAMRLLALVEAMRTVGVVLYSIMALGCFALAILSLRDYYLARQGKLAEMSLNLPEAVRQRIHGRIRAGRNAFWGASFVSGVVVSLLELACTGQVYLPTISFVIGVPEMRGSAILYLLVYNVLFVTPLLVVLVLAAYGMNARTLQRAFVRHAATTKIGMALLFMALGALLVMQVVSL